MQSMRFKLLLFSALVATSTTAFNMPSYAEDCTGTLPGADCTLDEDTTAPLTIDDGIVLSIGSSVNIDHTIDGSLLPGDGSINTFGIGNNITQNADIGGTTAIDSVSINDDITWTTRAHLGTDNTGSDIDLGGVDGGETLNFIDGGSYSGEIVGNNADVVNFGSDGNGGTFITGGQIESVTLIVTSGSLTVNNTVGGGDSLSSVTVFDGASIIANESVTTSGAFDLDGTLTIGAGNIFSADTYVADADTGTVIIELDRTAGATTSGQLSIASGGPVDLSNDILTVAVSSESGVLVDETIAGIIIGNTAPSIAPGQFIDSSYMYDFTLQPNGDNFDLVIQVNSLDSLATTENNLNVANIILGNLARVDQGTVNEIQGLLGNDPTSSAFNERLESLQPTVDGGYVQASLAIKNQAARYADKRVQSLYGNNDRNYDPTRLLKGSKDLSSGRRLPEKELDFNPDVAGSLWMQAYGQRRTQDKTEGIDGFDQTGSGIVFGADTGKLHDDVMFGMTAFIADAYSDSANANNTETNTRSLGVGVYGGHMVGNYLLSGSGMYVHNTNDVDRHGVGLVKRLDAFGEFVSQHLGLDSKLSRQYKTVGNFVFTPYGALSYDVIVSQKYKELGAETLSLTVDYDDVTIINAGIGVDIDGFYQTDGGINLYPSAYVQYSYDIFNTGVGAVSNFATAPEDFFTTEGPDLENSLFNVGGSVSAELAESWLIAAGYDMEYNFDAIGHSGYIQAIHDF